jgi:hypothetical protein
MAGGVTWCGCGGSTEGGISDNKIPRIDILRVAGGSVFCMGIQDLGFRNDVP